MRHPLLVVLMGVGAPVLWLGFVATFAPHEMLVGLLSAFATFVFTYYVCRQSGTALTLRSRDAAQALRIPWHILSGVAEITVVLFKDLVGIQSADSLYRVCGFDSGKRDPLRAARTVMATAFTTAAPNFIVVGVDPAQSRMLFHQISASSVPQITKALGAKS